MTESSKIIGLFGPGLTQRGIMLSGSLALAGMVLAFAPVLPRPSLWQMFEAPAGAPAAAEANSPWAGHLESPGAVTAASDSSQKLTSASYTTGFNVAAAEPLPAVAPVKAVAAPDSNVCPNGLNCAFRPKPGAARPQVAALNPPVHAVHHPAEKPSAGIAAFMPQMPSTDTLMKPFTFVANAVGGLMHGL